MKLSEDDKQKITNWIQDKCGNMRCTCCGYGQWQLMDFATLPIGFDVRSTRFFYHQGLPQISVVCTNCGHIKNFSPGVMGIKPEEPEEKDIEVSESEEG